MNCSCPDCNRECSSERRPYVCACGSVLGKNGWIKTITVRKGHSKTVKDYHTKKAVEGRKAWSKLHSTWFGTKEIFDEFKKQVPAGCECRTKIESILKKIPPRYDSPKEWFEFGVEFHNAVNISLDHPTVSLDRAYMLWRNRRPSTGRSRAVITVASGVEYMRVLAITRPFMQAYADRVDADLIDLDNDTENWGPMEKFRVYYFAQQYDEVLFVDADCVISDKCPDLFSMFEGDVVIHNDYPVLKSPFIINEERKKVARISGAAVPETEAIFNTGVVLTRKAASHVWIRPSVDIGTSHFAEQVWIEAQINRNGITATELPHQANWQYWYGKHSQPIVSFEDGLQDAWIAHASSSRSKVDTVKKIADYMTVKIPQPRIVGLTAVTSLSKLPHHLDIQERCLKTWKDMGLRVVSGNAKSEIDGLREIYPNVEFMECKESSWYERPTPRIYDLMRLVDGPILLINSDIELHGNQSVLLNAINSGACLAGLRHNYESSIFEASVEQWGIDAFLLHPEQIATFPDLDFAIGQTMWDYWVPYHLGKEGAKLRWFGEPFFFHKTHSVHWSKESTAIGMQAVTAHYGEDVNWEMWRKNLPFGEAQ